jgi:hypothetical protein
VAIEEVPPLSAEEVAAIAGRGPDVALRFLRPAEHDVVAPS